MLKQITQQNQNTPSGKVGGVIFGVVWTLFSSVFVAVGLTIFLGGFTSDYLLEVPCSISQFEIISKPNDKNPFRANITFEYRVDGNQFTGNQLSPEFKGSDSYEKLARMREEAFRGADGLSCYVREDDPSDAVLIRRDFSNWFGLIFVCFGGGFVLIGIGIITSSLHQSKKARSFSSSHGNETKMGGLLAFGFFGTFAAAGIGVFAGLVAPTAAKYFSAKGWVETPAEVIWSRVRTNRDSDGNTYRTDIFYRYEFESRPYRSNGYSLLGITSSSGRAAKQQVVKAHPKGTPITCYVNPDDPLQAIMNRDLGWWALFGLFPLPFAAVGLGGLYYTFSGKKEKPRKTEARSALSNKSTSTRRSANRSKPATRTHRFTTALGVLLFALFWNGIISVFLKEVWDGWKTDNIPWGLAIFMVPFTLVGLGSILSFLYQFLAIFSPIFVLELGKLAVKPGDNLTISWSYTGGSGSPKRVSLWLVGEEEAEYRRGTRNSVAKEIFFEKQILETTDRLVVPSGRSQLSVPLTAVPSFSGSYNKIRWYVVLKADVPWLPDVRDEYEITIEPSEEFYS